MNFKHIVILLLIIILFLCAFIESTRTARIFENYSNDTNTPNQNSSEQDIDRTQYSKNLDGNITFDKDINANVSAYSNPQFISTVLNNSMDNIIGGNVTVSPDMNYSTNAPMMMMGNADSTVTGNFPTMSPMVMGNNYPTMAPTMTDMNNYPTMAPMVMGNNYPTMAPTMTDMNNYPTMAPMVMGNNYPTMAPTMSSTLVTPDMNNYTTMAPMVMGNNYPTMAPMVMGNNYPTMAPMVMGNNYPTLAPIIYQDTNTNLSYTTIPPGVM